MAASLLPSVGCRHAGKAPPATKISKVIPSYCDICFMQCGINVTVEDGRAVKIEGNPHHPLSRGKLCPRGTGGLGQLYDEHRLKTPLLRVSNGGQQEFKAVSWDEALDYVAKKMKTIMAAHGPESMALLKHCKGAAPWVHLWHALGSKTEAHTSYAQCRGARDVGWKLTFGKSVGSPEVLGLHKAKVVAFIGCHLGENMHNVTVQDYTTGLRDGTKFIVVDPRHSTAASKAKYWLPIKPGTDIALLLAWINVLLKEELYDKAFIADHAAGLDELRAHVEEKTPDWAAPLTGLDAALIRQTAIELGEAAGESFVAPGRRFAWYGDDTQRARAMAIVNALLGAWNNEAGILLGQKYKVPKYERYPEKHKKGVSAFDKKEKFPFATNIASQDILRASTPGAYQASVSGKSTGEGEALVKGLVVYSTNIVSSIPNGRELVRQAAEHLDLLVVIDTMPAEITSFADVVLPDTTYLERHDVLSTPTWREPLVALRQPVVEPMYDSKPSWWIAKSLAEKLGLGEFFPYEHFSEVIDARLKSIGSSLEDINKKHGVLTEEFKKKELKFKTPSKKVELFSQRLADAGFDPLPDYYPPKDAPKGYYRLLYGRTPQHSFTKTTCNPILLELYGENVLWVAPAVAKANALQNGQEIVLENQAKVKSNRVSIRITERIRNDCVYLVHGFGREDSRLKHGYRRGANVNTLLTDFVEDPIMGSTGSQVNFVKILS